LQKICNFGIGDFLHFLEGDGHADIISAFAESFNAYLGFNEEQRRALMNGEADLYSRTDRQRC